jgi:hypothetical protein
MAERSCGNNIPVSQQIHPVVYRTILGLLLLLVLSAWAFFGGGYSGLALAVVSAFIFAAVTIPTILWRISRNRRDPRPRPAKAPTWHDWLTHDVDTRTGRLSGANAATELLLPIAAVAFAMTAFALVHFLAVGA